MTSPTFKSRFTFFLPDYWTPEQALAVVEFIGDLREAIWGHYSDQLIDIYRELNTPEPGNKRTDKPDDTSF
jgi:hypothetical protein